MFSTLTGHDDVDWAVYRYDPVYAEVPVVGAQQITGRVWHSGEKAVAV